MSLLPGQILPQTAPLGRVNDNGEVIIDKNWWLLLYNLILNSLAAGLSPDAVQVLAQIEIEADTTDAAALKRSLENLSQLFEVAPSDPVDLSRALILALDGILADPTPQAQPSQNITVAASPFTYTAPFDGQVTVTGGTVSVISLIRQGVTIATGLITGMIGVRRADQVQVTYTGVPTMVFLPS